MTPLGRETIREVAVSLAMLLAAVAVFLGCVYVARVYLDVGQQTQIIVQLPPGAVITVRPAPASKP